MSNILTAEQHDNVINGSEIPILIDFYAEWCSPCKMAAPVIDSIAEELKGKAEIYKVDIDKESQLAEKYNVMSVPTFIVLKNGAITARESGFAGRAQLLKLLDL